MNHKATSHWGGIMTWEIIRIFDCSHGLALICSTRSVKPLKWNTSHAKPWSTRLVVGCCVLSLAWMKLKWILKYLKHFKFGFRGEIRRVQRISPDHCDAVTWGATISNTGTIPAWNWSTENVYGTFNYIVHLKGKAVFGREPVRRT